MGDVGDHSKATRGRKGCRGKGVAKEKKVPRRGMGVARLERMRLLDQQKSTSFMIEDEEDIEKKARATTAPLFSCFLPLPYLLQRFPQVGVERGALELACNRSIGQWQFLESSIVTTTSSSLLPIERSMDGVHALPRDFSFTSMDGNNMINPGYTASSFAATAKLQGNSVQTSDRSDTCLDLSLSTVNRITHEGRNLSQESQQETRGVAAGMPRDGLGPELWETEAEKGRGCGRGRGRRCSRCTRASEFHCGGESESSFTSKPSSLPSPSLQLTLGLPS